MGLFSSKTEKEVLQTPEEAAARAKLSSLMNSGTPNLPKQEISGLSQNEQLASTMARDYATGEPQGLEHLRSVMQGSGNIMDNPSYKALFDETKRAGELENNRMGRSMQLRGGNASTSGRDMLGRTAAQNQSNLMATLAPYAAQNEQMKLTAAQSLAQLGESSILNRLNALGQTGALTRQLDQLGKDADYNRKMNMTMFPYTQTAGLADTILRNKADWSVTQSPSLFSQIAAPVAQVASGMMSGAAMGSALGKAMKPANAANPAKEAMDSIPVFKFP